jgi:hypothetical protein
VTATTAVVDGRATGARPITSSAPASEARPIASSALAHPSLRAVLIAMFAVVGATPPDDVWMASWITPPRR